MPIMTDIAAQQVQEPPPEYYTDMPVGDILRRTREHYGQSLMDVESMLRIRAGQLEALENGWLEQLPGRVYAIGFVRSYSEYLGLDGDKMVHLFKVQSVGNAQPQLHFPVAASESQIPNAWMIVGALVAGIVLIAVWAIFYAPQGPVRDNIPPVPETLQTSITEAPALPVAGVDPEEVDASAPDQDGLLAASDVSGERIVLEITANSWIEIRNAQGAAILRRVLKPGDRYTVPAGEEGLVMSTGNAGGIDVFVDGKKLPKLGRQAQVRRNIKLDADELLKTAE